MFRKLSLLIGLTETEIKIVLFIVVTFLLGFGYKAFFKDEQETTHKQFDYSLEDSLFFSVKEPDSLDIPVDYKQEVLDFNATNLNGKNQQVIPAAKSLNLNTAKLEELTLLPGIGSKTAERIIELRNKRGKFNSIRELLEIKGIGESKFQSLEKYLYIK
jgi:competence ComEA-like helix-hairpin-helix protein